MIEHELYGPQIREAKKKKKISYPSIARVKKSRVKQKLLTNEYKSFVHTGSSGDSTAITMPTILPLSPNCSS